MAREPLHEVAEVDAVLEHPEDAAEVLRSRELGRVHDVEQALAEDVLDGGGVELAHRGARCARRRRTRQAIVGAGSTSARRIDTTAST